MSMSASVEAGHSHRAEESILAELTTAPVAQSMLQSRVRTRVPGLTAKDYKAVLAALVAAEKIHGRPKVGRNGRPTKSVESYALGAPPPLPAAPRARAPEAFLAALQSGPLPPKELSARVKDAVPALSTKLYSEVLAELVASKTLHGRAKLTKNGRPTKSVAVYALGAPPPPDPRPFLEPVLTLWSKACRDASAAGVSEAALLAALLVALGAPSGAVAGGDAPAEDGRARVLKAVRELVAYEGNGALIPIRRLRAATGLGKNAFDAAVLALRSDDTVILHHHDFVGSLDEAERAELVRDAYGNHYVGIALRGVS